MTTATTAVQKAKKEERKKEKEKIVGRGKEKRKRTAPVEPQAESDATKRHKVGEAGPALEAGSRDAATLNATFGVTEKKVSKAMRKLTKKLGREPLLAEVAAYIAKKLSLKKTIAASSDIGILPASKDSKVMPTFLSPEVVQPVAPLVDTLGEPPRKGQIPDGLGGWTWPKRVTPTGNGTILLFYGYVTPPWTRAEHDAVMNFAWEVLTRYGCTGRLRCAREGLNGTLTGPHDGIRGWTRELAATYPEHFGKTDFKYVDNQPDSQMLKELKVFPVTELVTYGFPSTASASITAGGKHLKPAEYHKAMQHPNTVMIDVRNFNESLIGRFAPPGTEVLDPKMRRSTEFPKWVDSNIDKLNGKKILMYCTGGIRCERASAYLVEKGLTDVNQLEGGIHRYLEKYADDGGHWIGANYTFDKRFSHGAKNSQVISTCVLCGEPWERYAAQKKCKWCKIEILVCRSCDRKDKAKGPNKVKIDKDKLVCPLCLAPNRRKINQHGVQG